MIDLLGPLSHIGWYEDLLASCPEILPLCLIKALELLLPVWSISSLTGGREVQFGDATSLPYPDIVNSFWDFVTFSLQIPALYPGSNNCIHVACPESVAHRWNRRVLAGSLALLVIVLMEKPRCRDRKECAQGHILLSTSTNLFHIYYMPGILLGTYEIENIYWFLFPFLAQRS